MQLRPYQHTDYAQVINTFASQDYLDKYLNKGFPWNILSMMGILQNKYMVLEDNGQIVAAGCIRTKFQKPWLYAIAVRQDLRGKGLGKELIKQLLSHIQLITNSLLGEVKLTVDTDNIVALNLYTGLGFQKIGRKNNQYIMQYHYATI